MNNLHKVVFLVLSAVSVVSCFSEPDLGWRRFYEEKIEKLNTGYWVGYPTIASRKAYVFDFINTSIARLEEAINLGVEVYIANRGCDDFNDYILPSFYFLREQTPAVMQDKLDWLCEFKQEHMDDLS
jgi:hypothetical protein